MMAMSPVEGVMVVADEEENVDGAGVEIREKMKKKKPHSLQVYLII